MDVGPGYQTERRDARSLAPGTLDHHCLGAEALSASSLDKTTPSVPPLHPPPHPLNPGCSQRCRVLRLTGV
eukprot:444510-Prorocentrum_minimum.AAC.1